MNAINENRLTDEFEREMLREAMVSPRPLRVGSGLKSSVVAIGRGIGSLLAFVASVNEAMNQARARSAMYAGSQW